MEQEQEKIIWIKLLVFIVICSIKKKKNLLNIRIKSIIIEFVDWTMKTMNKNIWV